MQKKTNCKFLSKKLESNALVTPWYLNDIKNEKKSLCLKASVGCFLTILNMTTNIWYMFHRLFLLQSNLIGGHLQLLEIPDPDQNR